MSIDPLSRLRKFNPCHTLLEFGDDRKWRLTWRRDYGDQTSDERWAEGKTLKACIDAAVAWETRADEP